MSNLRLFIAGHVIGLSDPERAAERAKMNDESDFFDGIGFDVVNPVELLDDTSDPKDVLCKYIRMMLDCDTILLFDDEPCEECTAAAQIAIARSMHIIRENKGLVCQSAAAPVIRAIGKVLELEFKDYAGVRSRAKIVAYARAIFAYWCHVRGMRYEDITACLHIPSQKTDGDEYSPLSRRKIAQDLVRKYQDMRSSDCDCDFNAYTMDIEYTLNHDRDFNCAKNNNENHL